MFMKRKLGDCKELAPLSISLYSKTMEFFLLVEMS